MTTLESILEHHGNPGKLQMFIWILVMFTLFHVGMIQQFNVMMSYTPDHHCRPPPQSNWSLIHNSTNLYPDKCSMYNDPSNHSLGKTHCEHGYEYITINEEIYPSNEFDLVCEDFHWLETSLAITFAGVLIGGLIFGQVADRYGRKTVMSFALTALSILSTSIYFVSSFEAFVAIRFILGILNQGIQTVCLTYNSELFLPRLRTLTNSAIGIMWACMLPTLALLFYTLAHWRLVHLVMGVLSCVSAVYVWFLPESVSWLVIRWRLDDAAKILNSFARYNKIEPSPTLRDDLQDLAQTLRKRNEDGSTETTKWTQLFTSPIVRRITLSLLFIWFSTACIVFGLSFSISALKGNNMYINYVITGCLELTIRLAVMALFVRYGRITIMCPVLLACGVLTIVGFMIWHYVPEEYYVIQTIAAIVALTGRNMIAVNLTMLIILTSELIPVSLRSTGVGFGFAAARLGNVISPYARFLRILWIPLPQMIYGAMAIGAGILILTLPETFNKPMPNTIKDVEDLVTSRKNKNKGQEMVINNAPNDEEEPQLQSLIYQSVKDFAGNMNNKQ